VNGVKLATVAAKNRTLIAVAENDAPKNKFHDKSGIYQFDAFGLVKIQSIDMHYASDIVMWRIHNDVYMSVAQFMSNKTGNIHYEIELPIYKWLGGHFDLVQIIPSKGATRVAPFVADNSHFLAIANFRDDRGQTRIYSQIYKYDYHGEKFELYQNILTRACNDIKVFSLSHDRRKDVFLVVANSHEKGNCFVFCFWTSQQTFRLRRQHQLRDRLDHLQIGRQLLHPFPEHPVERSRTVASATGW
jgi:hypothetical protein